MGLQEIILKETPKCIPFQLLFFLRHLELMNATDILRKRQIEF